jgi:hypothetical protein
MKWPCLILAAGLLAGCGGKTEKSMHAELDSDFAKGEVMLACKASSSGKCHALFLVDTERKTIEVAASATGSTAGINDGTYYCVDVSAPDPAKCRPRALASGKQIVRSSTVIK